MQRLSWFGGVVTFALVLNLAAAQADQQSPGDEPAENRSAGENDRTDDSRADGAIRVANRPAVRAVQVDPEKMKQRRELAEKMMSKYRELRKLKEAGKEDAAEKVQAELQELRKKMQGMGPVWHARPGGFAGGQSEAAKKIRGRFAELRKQIEAAEKAGNEEKVKELKEQARNLARRAFAHHTASARAGGDDRYRGHHAHHGKSGAGKCGRGKGDCRRGSDRADSARPGSRGHHPRHAHRRPGGDRPHYGRVSDRPSAAGPKSPGQRLHHMRLAAASLDAAGYPQHAAKIREEGKKVMQQMQHDRPSRSAAGDAELRQHVRRLTEEVRRLRAEVAKLSKVRD